MIQLNKMKNYICTSCGFSGRPQRKAKGSFLIEIVLWLFFILPGIVYSAWRLTSNYSVCPKCENATMIPTDTPLGQKLIRETVELQKSNVEFRPKIENKTSKFKKYLKMLFED